MSIQSLRIFQVDLPLKEGRYSWADGKFVEIFDSTIVEITTGDGVVGVGEVCPLGPFYLPAFGAGARAAIGELAPHLLTLDPCEIGVMNQVMDTALLGHPYAKSAIDMACWDILGKRAGMSICDLMGGRHGNHIDLYRAITQLPANEMAQNLAHYRDQGYRKFQLKVGAHPLEDIERIRACSAVLEAGETLVADANTGWLSHEALQVVNGVRDLPVYIEQPCKTYDESVRVRHATSLPFILDENIDGVAALLRAESERAMDVINLKISKVGGLTKARQMRDLCVTLGIPMTIEDSWGGDVVTAAIAHLAHSTPERFRFSATDFNSYVTVATANGAPQRQDGKMTASDRPGLGVELKYEVLGDPVAEYVA
jgi:L-alanine-DL-glutamate epimerase-like enolase superfamily enzyme